MRLTTSEREEFRQAIRRSLDNIALFGDELKSLLILKSRLANSQTISFLTIYNSLKPQSLCTESFLFYCFYLSQVSLWDRQRICCMAMWQT